ncbi:MAG TPA: response regulator [Thermoanaerobaculia bacterium]|nr:response regulator [Thermoanaerobaculia bacterium]HUM30193.1 response regulator [Thermoanaerobaculia bacterium]HXK68358.1 response regulator [Thermoanaerobaculia bacterium]
MGYKPSVIIADDSEAFLMYLSLVLNRMGFDIIPVENGYEAIKLGRILSPDIIMMDIMMPEMDGITALRNLKSDSQLRHIPVIMITVVSDTEKVEECMRIGASGYVTKPIKLSRLHETVNQTIPYTHFQKRKFIRATINQKILVESSLFGSKEYFAETLSEMGIYFRTNEAYKVGEPVKLTFTLKNQTEISLSGSIIYRKGLYGDVFKRSPGVAVKFKEPSVYERMLLKEYIAEKLIGDILDEQKESLFVKEDES